MIDILTKSLLTRITVVTVRAIEIVLIIGDNQIMALTQEAHSVILKASILCLVFLTGCQSTPPSERSWQFCFTSDEGKAMLLTASTADLYRGRTKPNMISALDTIAVCRYATHNAGSGRIATIENNSSGYALRVYKPEGNSIGEYISPSIRCGKAFSKPVLNPSGTWLAFVRSDSTVCIEDIDSPDENSMRYFHPDPNRSESTKLYNLSFIWLSEDTLATEFNDTVYLVNTNGEVTVLSDIENKRVVLCGSVDGAVVTTNSTYCQWQLKVAETNEMLGIVRAGHQYAYFISMSPCGSYVIYHYPGTFGRGLYIHHIKTGRRVRLPIPSNWIFGSWEEL